MPRKRPTADALTSDEVVGRFETIISELPHGRGRVQVTRNLDTGDQAVEVIEEHFTEKRITCPHCAGIVIIPEYDDGEEE